MWRLLLLALLQLAVINWQLVAVLSFTPLTTEAPKEEDIGSNAVNIEDGHLLQIPKSQRQLDSSPESEGQRQPVYSAIQSIESSGLFGIEYNGTVNNATKYVWKFNYNGNEGGDGRGGEDSRQHHLNRLLFLRMTVQVDENAKISFPVEFEVRHSHRTQQWTLPNKSSLGRSVNKSLCFQQIYDEDEDEQVEEFSMESNIVYVTISTSSRIRTSFKLKVNIENENFITNFNDPRKVEVSPLSPAYFRLVSSSAFTARYALLYVHSDKDEGCVSVSLQSPMCPIGDHDSDIKLRGTRQTMSRMAAITIKMEDLEKGRFLSFLMHENDSECEFLNENLKDNLHSSTTANIPLVKENKAGSGSLDKTRFKTLSFVLKEKINDEVYLFSTLGIFMFMAAFCILFGVMFWKIFRIRPYSDDTKDGQIEHGNSPSSLPTEYHNGVAVITQSPTPSSDYDLCCCFFLVSQSQQRSKPYYLQESCKKCPKDIAKGAHRYVGTFSVVAAFYILPVFQFVHFYQLVLTKPGNEDLCYYNYLCLHPLGQWKDFNHIFSNIAYVMLGFLFLTLVYLEDRERRCKNKKEGHHRHPQECGIHSHFGIPYAMGAALVMEGVLSAMYHVCPNHLSFQFDMSFMYVIAVLCMVKIYQARHPDTNASACLAFGSLAVMIVLGVAATVIQASYLWMMTTIVHISVVFLISVHVYAWGDWKFDWKIFQDWNIFQARLLSPLQPFRRINWMTVFLFGTNIINWVIAALGFILFFKFSDVSSHLLFVVLINLGLYSVIYIVYKMKHGESILWPTKMYLLVSLPIWTAGVYTFSCWSANWQLSPAESRKLNADCVVMRFYDMHDVWHFLSAFGMFFMFMFFFTLDDDLKLVKRTEIKVF